MTSPSPNRGALAAVAHALGRLRDQLVLVGGQAAELLMQAQFLAHPDSADAIEGALPDARQDPRILQIVRQRFESVAALRSRHLASRPPQARVWAACGGSMTSRSYPVILAGLRPAKPGAQRARGAEPRLCPSCA